VGVTGSACAAPKKGPSPAEQLRRAEKAAQEAAKVQAIKAFAPLVAELREVSQLLELADRDYKGHRARAVNEITAAVKALPHVPLKRQAQGGNEPQALSDAQLALAIKQLVVIQTQLASTTGPGPAKAAGHINTAIKELEIALTIK
jgi:hypothetical protein